LPARARSPKARVGCSGSCESRPVLCEARGPLGEREQMRTAVEALTADVSSLAGWAEFSRPGIVEARTSERPDSGSAAAGSAAAGNAAAGKAEAGKAEAGSGERARAGSARAGSGQGARAGSARAGSAEAGSGEGARARSAVDGRTRDDGGGFTHGHPSVPGLLPGVRPALPERGGFGC
jgi:hypothetical protein